jgi:hypothetical protein
MKESPIPAEPECFVRSAVSHHPPRSLLEYFGLSIRQMIEVGISSRTPYRSIIGGGESKKTCWRFREFLFDRRTVEESMELSGAAKPDIAFPIDELRF